MITDKIKKDYNRQIRILEASGSIPLTSTNYEHLRLWKLIFQSLFILTFLILAFSSENPT
jgi:hypothetical protein